MAGWITPAIVTVKWRSVFYDEQCTPNNPKPCMPVSSSLTSVLDCHDDSALRTYNQTLGLALSPEVTELLSEQGPLSSKTLFHSSKSRTACSIRRMDRPDSRLLSPHGRFGE